MDKVLRELERRVATGDPIAAQQLAAAMKRANRFYLLPTASKRIRQRWRVHNEGRCKDNCKLCRKGIPREI